VNFSHADEDTEMVYVANPPSVYADHLAAAAGDSSRFGVGRSRP
jgi:hypothetical protein